MSGGKNFIIVDNLEIFYKDLPSGKTYNKYKSLCIALKGDGWRIPNINELSYMYSLHSLGILGFSNNPYFSTTNKIDSIGRPKPYTVQCIHFSSGDLFTSNTLTHNYNDTLVRPVRSIIL